MTVVTRNECGINCPITAKGPIVPRSTLGKTDLLKIKTILQMFSSGQCENGTNREWPCGQGPVPESPGPPRAAVTAMSTPLHSKIRSGTESWGKRPTNTGKKTKIYRSVGNVLKISPHIS